MILDQFLDWINDAPVSSRIDAVDALARAYLYSQMNVQDRNQLEAAMLIILDDSSSQVREKLAHVLASNPEAPKAVILGLVSDLPHIASPILRASPLLLESELIDCAAQGSTPTQIAIASRYTLSKALCAAICEVASLEAVMHLLENKGAEIANISMKRLIERFGCEAALRARLLERADLPIDLRHYLLERLGDALQQSGLIQHSLSPSRMKRVFSDAQDKATITMIDDSEKDEIIAFIEHLRISDNLKPVTLLRAALHGKINFLSFALASLSLLPIKHIEKLIKKGKHDALNALFAKAGMPQSSFSILTLCCEAWRYQNKETNIHQHISFKELIMADLITLIEKGCAALDEENIYGFVRRFISEEMRMNARSMLDNRKKAA